MGSVRIYLFTYKTNKMAVVFDKDLDTTKLLFAYNNNIVRFKSDDLVKIPKTAQLIGLGIDVLLYPHPNGSFYFNFKEYVSALINTKNFIDDTPYDLDGLDDESFTYDVSNGCYLQGDIVFKINFTDDTFESTVKNLSFIAGAEQLEDYKKKEILFQANKLIVLSPVADRTNNTTYLKYWEGYPFEFSFYNRDFPTSAFKIKNNSNGLDYEFTSKGKVTSMFLADGRTDVTIEDFLPLTLGQNNCQFLIDDVNQNLNLIIDKADTDCGIYVKFLNKYGRFNYWLFSKNYFRNRSSKYLAELENDFEDLGDTISPTLQVGKISDGTIKCAALKIDENQKRILEGIIDSPKILMFTGDRFSKSDLTDWLEVRLKTTTFSVESPNKKIHSFYLELDLPARNTITL